MRRLIVAYYFLFVILFTAVAFTETKPVHSIYIVNSVSGDLLIPKSAGYSPAVQMGGSYEAGISYVHESGFTAGIKAGIGLYNKGVSEEYIFYRGFNFTQIGLETGYIGNIHRFSWLALISAEGRVCEYEASVQQFFFPSVSLIGGFGIRGIHDVFLTLPVTVQFRSDLELSIGTGLGLRLCLNAAPSMFGPLFTPKDSAK